MEKIKNFTGKTFLELTDYLGKISQKKDDAEKVAFVSKQIKRFLPNITSIESFELFCAIEEHSEELFQEFINNHPDIDVNIKGTSPLPIETGWEVRLDSIEYIYMLAKNILIKNNNNDSTRAKIHKQVCYAKTLNNLKSMRQIKKGSYGLNKLKFIKKFPNNEWVNYKTLLKYEKLENIIPNKDIFFNYVFAWCINKKYINFSLFLSNLFSRLEILLLDTDLKNPASKELIKNINDVIRKNN